MIKIKGYPNYIATKQDFLNLLNDPELKDRAIKDLQNIYSLADDRATKVVSGSEETDDLVIEEVDNPLPMWKQKGFGSREEVADLIARSSNETKNAKRKG